MQNCAWVRIESYDGGNSASLVRSFHNHAHDQLVPEVQAIKHAQCKDRRTLNFGVVSSVEKSHKKQSTQY